MNLPVKKTLFVVIATILLICSAVFVWLFESLNSPLEETRQKIVNKMTDQSALARVASNDVSREVKIAAVNQLVDQVLLSQVAANNTDKEARKLAVAKLTDQNALSQVAKTASDDEIRLLAINSMTDQNQLSSIAIEDKNQNINLRAVDRLTNMEALAHVASSSGIEEVAIKATSKILANPEPLKRYGVVSQMITSAKSPTVLLFIAFNDSLSDVRQVAAKRITEREHVIQIATKHSDPDVRLIVLPKLEDQAVLADLAVSDPSSSVRRSAIEKVSDQQVIEKIATSKQEDNWEVRKIAVSRLSSQALLAEIAINDRSTFVSSHAVEKVTDLELLRKIALDESGGMLRGGIRKKAAERFIDLAKEKADYSAILNPIPIETVFFVESGILKATVSKGSPQLDISGDEFCRADGTPMISPDRGTIAVRYEMGRLGSDMKLLRHLGGLKFEEVELNALSEVAERYAGSKSNPEGRSMRVYMEARKWHANNTLEVHVIAFEEYEENLPYLKVVISDSGKVLEATESLQE